MLQLPWKVNKENKSDNFGLALGKHRSLQRIFAKDSNYCEQYNNATDTKIKRGYLEQYIEPSEEAHDGVTKDCVTIPVRVVFVSSTKANDR